MDLPYNTGWLCAANRRNVRRSVDLDHLPSASASSSVGRLLLALAVIAVIVGLLGHAADTGLDDRVASIVKPNHSGALK